MKSADRKTCFGVDAQQQAQWEESCIIILTTYITSGYGLNIACHCLYFLLHQNSFTPSPVNPALEGSIHKSRR